MGRTWIWRTFIIIFKMWKINRKNIFLKEMSERTWQEAVNNWLGIVHEARQGEARRDLPNDLIGA